MNFVKYTKEGIRFFRNQDIGEVFIDDLAPIFISLDTYNHLSLKLEKYDILTPRVGTLGSAAVVFENYLPASANQNLAQIKVDFAKIDPFYLSVFLCCRFGHKQFERMATGNVQSWLNLIQIKSLKTFVPSVNNQKLIREIVLDSLKELNSSKNFYHQAENLLLEELGLNDFKIEADLSYIANFSAVQTADRIDAEYFHPKFEKIISKIKTNNAKPLGNLATMKKGFEPGSEAYEEEGKLFIRVSSLSKFGVDDKDQKYLSADLYQKLKKDFQPQVGEILLTKDATPGIASVLKEEIEGIISGGILRLKTGVDINSEYLALCLNSLVGQMQAERDAGGSIIEHWKPEQIRNILIPVLPKETQQKIADLVKQSHETRQKSKEFLEEAKRKVEEMIEKRTS